MTNERYSALRVIAQRLGLSKKIGEYDIEDTLNELCSLGVRYSWHTIPIYPDKLSWLLELPKLSTSRAKWIKVEKQLFHVLETFADGTVIADTGVGICFVTREFERVPAAISKWSKWTFSAKDLTVVMLQREVADI